jgi:hypothetical protein
MKWVLAVAAVSLLLAAGSVSAASLIDSGDVKNNSLTGKDVKNRSLTKNDFRGSVRGPRGFRGAQGPQGPAGPSALGGITVVYSGEVPYGPTDVVQSAIAFCPAGQRVVSGGGTNLADEQIAATEALSNRTGWFVIGVDLVANGGETIEAQALCAPTGRAVAARSSARARSQVARMETQVRAQMRR